MEYMRVYFPVCPPKAITFNSLLDVNIATVHTDVRCRKRTCVFPYRTTGASDRREILLKNEFFVCFTVPQRK